MQRPRPHDARVVLHAREGQRVGVVIGGVHGGSGLGRRGIAQVEGALGGTGQVRLVFRTLVAKMR